MLSIIRIGFASLLLTAMGCTSAVVTPMPPTVYQIAVLPAYKLGAVETIAPSAGSYPLFPLERTVGDVLAEQARLRLAEKGLDVIDAISVKVATKERIPTSPQMAAKIMEEAQLDAAVLYIEVRRWEPTPYERGLKADGVIVALDVLMVDPKTGAILWQVHRPSRPVPLYGVVLTGHAHLFVAETVMREVFAQLGPRKPGT
jgi:hypothetical protein